MCSLAHVALCFDLEEELENLKDEAKLVWEPKASPNFSQTPARLKLLFFVPPLQDYLIALSLQQQPQGALGLSDLELAQQLQQEEYQQQQAVLPAPVRVLPPPVSLLPPALCTASPLVLPPAQCSAPASSDLNTCHSCSCLFKLSHGAFPLSVPLPWVPSCFSPWSLLILTLVPSRISILVLCQG